MWRWPELQTLNILSLLHLEILPTRKLQVHGRVCPSRRPAPLSHCSAEDEKRPETQRESL